MLLSDDETRKLDRVADTRILADAQRLGQAFNCPVETHAGRQAVRLAVHDGLPLELVPELTDLRPYDQVVMVLSTAGAAVKPSLQIELTTRTAGLIADDSFSTGSGAELRFDAGWGEYPFPWENFLIFGMGELVYPVRIMRLRFGAVEGPATVWLAELRIERRERADGPRLTDRGLAAELNGLDGPGLLAQLRRRDRPCHPFGSFAGGVTAVRDEPRHLQADGCAATTSSSRSAGADRALLEAADTICEHRINGYAVGNPVDWRLNPNGYLEWMHAFNRHGWMNTLVNAYTTTGDARYARKLDELWLSWLRANPEPIGHNGGGDPAWETLSTAVRIYGSWLRAFFLLLNDPEFRDATRIEILKSFHGHAEHLLAHKGHANNWLIVESRVLFMLGMLFPEFKRASAWLTEGMARLDRELARQVWPDGADWELAPGYHMMACSGFLEPLELARLNGQSLPSLFDERLPATFEYIAGMTRPDGTLPSVNDSGGWRARAGGLEYLRYGARLFDRPDLAHGPEGPYAGRSRVFPDAGFHVLASGSGSRAFWSYLDGGPPGASHCHDDALNVEFFAFGRPFIVDPGITGYLHDAWTAYYRNTRAHNSVLVNGADQAWATQSHAERTGSARGRVRCALGNGVDGVRAVYDRPYHGQPGGLAHTRTLLFIRGRYWIVFDEVTGTAARDMEARFQFVPLRLTLDARRRVFRTLRQNLPNLEVWPLKVSGRMKLAIATGETDPVGGWVSDGEDQPAPQARIQIVRRDAAEPLRLVTIVYPFDQGVGSGMKARLRSDNERASALRLDVGHLDGSRDRVVYDGDAAAWQWPRRDGIPPPVVIRTGQHHLAWEGDGWQNV